MRRLLLTLAAAGCAGWVLAEEDFARHVDVFTGTSATGHTHPAASCPFGMIQAGPDTGERDWAHCSGYQYADRTVLGYSQNHLSGTGCPEYGDVRILPFSGEFRGTDMTSAIDKRSECGEPGYYCVRQKQDGVLTEVAAADKAAIYRFTWDGDRAVRRVFVNLPVGIGERKWAIVRTRRGTVSHEGDTRIEGLYYRSGWISERPVAFAIEFDRPWRTLEELPAAVKGEAPRFVATFAPGEDAPLRMKVALSCTSAAAARRNLAATIPGWDFDGVRSAARARWNALFARSVCEGDARQKTNWYTALYHLYLQPNDWSDVGGRPEYTTLSLWDTFRAVHPFYTLVTPEIVDPILLSMMDMARKEGKLPVMSYGGRYIECMIGNHAIPVIADAYLKGFRGFDVREAFSMVTNSVTVCHGRGKAKEDWDVLDKHGYYPFDLIRSESVSRTLECAYNDWCAARFAEALGERQAQAFFDRRCGNWRNLLDPETGWMRGRDSAGKWRVPFNPYALGGGEERLNDFTEGNSFQYSWFVPHDPDGLISAMGGREPFTARLEGLFALPTEAAGMGERVDVSGLIGQYAHGNEPSHHVIYLFQHAGHPELTARFVRKVFDTQYAPGPKGLCGNDDCGQMSAWYVFSAMGLYPLNPCGGEYTIGAPQVPRVEVKVRGEGGRWNKFTVIARGLSQENKYVKSVTLDGRPLKGCVLRHEDILRGGELVFEMHAGEGTDYRTITEDGYYSVSATAWRTVAETEKIDLEFRADGRAYAKRALGGRNLRNGCSAKDGRPLVVSFPPRRMKAGGNLSVVASSPDVDLTFAVRREDVPAPRPDETLADRYVPFVFDHSELGGEIDRRILNLTTNHFMLSRVYADWVTNFEHRIEIPKKGHYWKYVGVGKMIDAASLFARYTKFPEVAARTKELRDGILATRDPDGYIGTFVPRPNHAEIGNPWVLHELEYLALGLLRHHLCTGSAQSLADARAVADFIIAHFPDWSPDVYGMSEMMIQLYRLTGERRYLDFGADRALGSSYAFVPMPLRKWRQSYANNGHNHVYGNMSRCFAQTELYRIDGDDGEMEMSRQALDVFFGRGRGAMVVSGTCGNTERFDFSQYGGAGLGESCATAYIIRWLDSLLRLEGDFAIGDAMERAMYNALFGANSPDGRRIRYFTPFSGRREYDDRWGYCCPGNLRRIVGELPQFVAYRGGKGVLAVNLYHPFEKAFDCGKGAFRLRCSTEYPSEGTVTFTFLTAARGQTLALRIPKWATGATFRVNGGNDEAATPDARRLLSVARDWKAGDGLTLTLPMRLRFVPGRERQRDRVAFLRGPVVYCVGLAQNEISEAEAEGLRDWTVDPSSAVFSRDDAIRPNGRRFSVDAWKDDPAARRKLVFTEFADPSSRETYFRLSGYCDDELIDRGW